MVAGSPSQGLKQAIAPVAGVFAGLAMLAFVWALKRSVLEGLVLDSGIAAFLPAAAPPLGTTARAALAIFAGSVTGVVVWLVASLAVARTARTIRVVKVTRLGEEDDGVELPPVLRRADAHPDAPPRPPLRAARDLGTPFLEIRAADSVVPEPFELSSESEIAPALTPLTPPEPAPRPRILQQPVIERDLPQDLRQPLSAFDPGAIRDEPLPVPTPVRALRRKPRPAVFNPGERFETFAPGAGVPPMPTPSPAAEAAPAPVSALAPVGQTPAEEAIAAPETDATIHALLARLERGVKARGLVDSVAEPPPEASAPPPRQEGSLKDALASLRNMAIRA